MSNSKSEADSNECLGRGGLSARVFETASPPGAQRLKAFLPRIPSPRQCSSSCGPELARLNPLQPCVNLPAPPCSPLASSSTPPASLRRHLTRGGDKLGEVRRDREGRWSRGGAAKGPFHPAGRPPSCSGPRDPASPGDHTAGVLFLLLHTMAF